LQIQLIGSGVGGALVRHPLQILAGELQAQFVGDLARNLFLDRLEVRETRRVPTAPDRRLPLTSISSALIEKPSPRFTRRPVSTARDLESRPASSGRRHASSDAAPN